MTIVLRLQGLNIEAGSEDIRKFFNDLYIPEGGVYIIGGHLGEAFIMFTTEKDGQLAMRLSGSPLRGSRVTLHISSLAEIQRKMESNLQKETLPIAPLSVRKSPLSPVAPLPDSATTLLLGLVAVIQGLQSNQQGEHNIGAPLVSPSPRTPGAAMLSGELDRPREAFSSSPGFARLYGLAKSVTKNEICHFFKGLSVQEVIVNVKLGLNYCCLVKFADVQDACDAMSFNHQWLGHASVEVRGATEAMWTYAVQQCDNPSYEPQETQHKPQERPTYVPQGHRPSYKPHTEPHEQGALPRVWAKRRSEDRSLSQSPKRYRSHSLSPVVEYCIMAKNLPKKITKTELKELFGCQNIPNSKIIHLQDKDGQRTDTTFIIFDQTEDYVYAINLNGCHIGSQAIDVSTITKEKMEAILSNSRVLSVERSMVSNQGPTERHSSVKPKLGVLPIAQTCIYIRNLPADVQKRDIQDLFLQFKVGKDFIFLLRDKEGNGIGEVLVQLKTEKYAKLALKLHRQTFLGTRLLLTCITFQQMENILNRNQ